MNVSHNPTQLAELDSFHRQVAELIVTTLNLDLPASELAADRLLFGENGLGLDSIDGLEIALVIEHKYGIKIGAADEGKDKRFATVRSLAAFIQEAQAAKAELGPNESDSGRLQK